MPIQWNRGSIIWFWIEAHFTLWHSSTNRWSN